MASVKSRSRHRRAVNTSVRDPSPCPAQNGEVDGDPRFKYKLEDLELKTTLGTGTFGRVVLAQHKTTKKYFALKIMTISEVIRLKQVEHVRSEKAILQEVRHPFIVDMLWARHDETFLYMLLEYICGGELFSYLRNAGRFPSATCNFYAAEIVSSLEYLHSLKIVYRDLKPENLLLDQYGHLKLTDFGFAKKLDDRTWTLCGTPEYLAPEIIQSKGHNKAVDWWALGILIYEMLIGYPPFFDDNPFGIYQKILAGTISWPRHVDPVAKDLIRKLLVQDRTKRLGNMKGGAVDVKNHKWFRHLDWNEVYHRKLTAPIIPEISHLGDTRNFVEYPVQDWVKAIKDELMVEPSIVPRPDSDGNATNFDEYPDDNWKGAAPADVEALALFKDF